MNDQNDLGFPFFIPESSPFNHACLNFARNGWHLYAEGFREAGNLLLSHIQTENVGIDKLVYPVGYILCHYLELRLKEIIVQIEVKFGVEKPKNFFYRHDLLMRWDQCFERIQQACDLGLNQKESKEITSKIQSLFSQMKNCGFSQEDFRYPVSTKEELSLKGQRYLDLHEFTTLVNQIATELEAFSVLVQVEADMRFELGQIN